MSKPSRLAAVLVATGVLVAGVGLVLWRERRVVCPAGTQPDRARQVRIERWLRVGLGRLSDRADARQLARAWRENEAWCFGQRSELVETGSLQLDAALDDGEAAARAGHLLLHQLVAAPWPSTPDLPCDQRVRQALAAEARALALELELRRLLGVVRPRVDYALAADSESVFSPAAIQLILERHPDGAPGVPALGEAYAERCRHETARR
jgi:hypothetical protein